MMFRSCRSRLRLLAVAAALAAPTLGACQISDTRLRSLVDDLIGALNVGSSLHSDAPSESEADRAEALLIEIGKPAVEQLIKGLDSDNEWIRGLSADALGRIGDRSAYQALARVALTDEKLWVRRTAASSLGRLKDARAFDVLTTIVAGGDREVTRGAILGLGFLGDVRAIPILLLHLANKVTSIPSGAEVTDPAATEALGLLGPAAIPELERLLGDRNELVAGAAIEALSDIDSPAALALLKRVSADPHRRLAAWRALLAHPLCPPDVAIQALKDPDWDIRMASLRIIQDKRPSGAARAIGELIETLSRSVSAKSDDGRDASALVQAIRTAESIEAKETGPAIRAAIEATESWTIRKYALRALGELGGPESIPTYLWALGELKRPGVWDDERETILWALGRSGKQGAATVAGLLDRGEITPEQAAPAIRAVSDPAALSIVMRMAEIDSTPLQIAAARALSKIGGEKALLALTRLTEESDPFLVATAAAGLLRLGSANGIAPMFEACRRLEWLPDELPEAFEKITEHGAEAIAACTRAISSDSELSRELAVRSLSFFGGSESAAALRAALKDRSPGIAVYAARGLAKIGGSDDVPALIAALDYPNVDVKIAAYRAIRAVEGKNL